MMASQREAEVTQAPGSWPSLLIIIFISIFTDGGAIGRYQDGLREIKEGVKHCLVVVTNQVVKLPLQDRYWVICQKS